VVCDRAVRNTTHFLVVCEARDQPKRSNSLDNGTVRSRAMMNSRCATGHSAQPHTHTHTHCHTHTHSPAEPPPLARTQNKNRVLMKRTIPESFEVSLTADDCTHGQGGWTGNWTPHPVCNHGALPSPFPPYVVHHPGLCTPASSASACVLTLVLAHSATPRHRV
jgi:hypothetical protein